MGVSAFPSAPALPPLSRFIPSPLIANLLLTFFIFAGHRWHHLARYQGISKFSLWRATNRCHYRREDASACPRRQLRCLGWSLLDFRLRRQGRATEGGSLECHHRWFLHRWFPCDSRRLQGGAKRCHWLCRSARRHRRCRHRFLQDALRLDQAGGSSASASRGDSVNDKKIRRQDSATLDAPLNSSSFLSL